MKKWPQCNVAWKNERGGKAEEPIFAAFPSVVRPESQGMNGMVLARFFRWGAGVFLLYFFNYA